MDETRKKKLVNLLEMKENPIAKTLIEIERVDSAIQEIQNDSQKIVEAINELDQTKASKRELEIAIESVQTIKGDRGFKGEKGADGKDGKDGLNGKDGKDGVDGIDGKDSKDGVDGIDGKDGKDGSPDTPDQVIEKIHKSKKLIKKEKIEGLEDIERKADFALNRPLIQGVGGGSSGIREIRAGSGISVSNVNEIVTVSAPGSTTDEKVAYKSGSTPGYLKDVTVAGTGITLSEGTGGDAGKLKITNSFVETDPVFSSWLSGNPLTGLTTKTLQISFKAIYGTSPVWKLLDMETGTASFPNGIQINSIYVKSSEADPTTELTGDIKYCDAQGTGAFPGANHTLIASIDTTTGNYSQTGMTTTVATNKVVYLLLDAIADDSVWTITINYTLL